MPLRNMLTDINSDYLKSMMQLISTQNEEILTTWVLDYCETHLMPIFNKYFPEEKRIDGAISLTRSYLKKDITKNELKIELSKLKDVTKDVKKNHVAFTIAKTIISGTATPLRPTNSLSLALYGSVALAYENLGLKEDWGKLEEYAYTQVVLMQNALKKIMIEDESNPVKINWYC